VRATARCFLLYKDGDQEIVAEGRTEGTLVLPGRGTHGFGWDPVFLPDGASHTFAELTGHEKDGVSHRGKAWREMVRRLGRGIRLPRFPRRGEGSAEKRDRSLL